MKKVKALAWILTLATLLSLCTAAIPVSVSAVPNADVASTPVGNKRITIDGTPDSSEIWGTIPAYPALILNQYAPDAINIDKSVTVKQPSTIKIANDDEFIYILYNAKQYSASGLYFQFVFGGQDFTNVNAPNGEAALIRIETDKTRGWSGSDSMHTATGSLGYFRYASSSEAPYTAGNPTYEKTEWFIQGPKNASGASLNRGNGTVVELRYPIPESAKKELAKGDVTFGLAVWEKHGTNAGKYCTGKNGATVNATKDNAGFVLPSGYSWNATNTVSVSLKSTARLENPVIQQLIGSNVTVDGIASANENWAYLPFTRLTEKRTSAITSQGVQATTEPGTVRLSTDGEYLYIFYETTNPDSLGSVYFQIGFHGETANTNKKANTQGSGKISGNWSQLCVRLNKSAVWDPSKNLVHNNATDTVAQFIYGSYSNNTTYPTAHPTRAKTQIAVKVTTEGSVTRRTAEIAFPLSDEAKETMKSGNVDMTFGVWENGKNAYVASEGYSWSVGRISTKLYSYSFRLPVLIGIQSRTVGDRVDIRFVSATSAPKNLATASAGYFITHQNSSSANPETRQTYSSTFYKNLNVGSESISASSCNADYFFCHIIKGLEKGQSYSFEVECWVKDSDRFSTGSNTVHITLTVNEDGSIVYD